jgi:hypothetical protein
MTNEPKVARLPDRLIVTGRADGKPLSGLLILLSIVMTRKNDFNMVLGPTGPKGVIQVSKKKMEEEIKRSLEMFPMDYEAMSLFAGELSLSAMNLLQIDSALNAYDLFHAASEHPYPKGYRKKLETAWSRLYRLAPKRLDVEVTVHPKSSTVRIVTRWLKAC